MRGEIFYRTMLLEAEPKTETATERVVRLSFASEEPRLMKDKNGNPFWERLSLGPGDAKLDLIRREGALYENHNYKMPEIGYLEKYTAQIEPDRKIRAIAHVTDATWQARIDAGKEKIGVSVGYHWLSMVREETNDADGLPVRWYAFEPFEVSLLTEDFPPADGTVGIGRSRSFSSTANFMIRNSIEELADLVRAAQCDSKKIETLTRAECEEYSLARLLRGERDIEQQIARANPRIGQEYCGGQFVPFQIWTNQTRDLQASAGGPSGGFFVGTDLLNIRPALLNKNVCADAGMTFVTGLTGNVGIPRQENNLTVEPQSEIGAAAASNPVFGQLAMAPKRVTVNFRVARQLLIQSGNSGEAFLREMIFRAIAQRLDQQVLLGGTAAHEMVGITNVVGIGVATFNGAVSQAAVQSFEDKLGGFNADGGECVWIVSPSTRSKMKQTLRVAGGSYYIWDQVNSREALVNGFRALTTNTMSSTHQVLFLNAQHVIVGIFGTGIDVIQNPYSLATSAVVEFSAHLWADCAVVHPQAICCSSDAGNQ